MEEWKKHFCVATKLDHARYKDLCGEFDIQYCSDCSGIYKYYGCRKGSQSLGDYAWGKIFISVDDFENILRDSKSIDEYSII